MTPETALLDPRAEDTTVPDAEPIAPLEAVE